MADAKVSAAAAAANGSGARQLQLNPERAPALIAKYQKYLGKEIKSIDLSYTADGIDIGITGLGVYAQVNDKGESLAMTIAQFRAIRERESKPSDAESLQAFRNKFELRLNEAFPAKGPASGSDADIQTFLNGLDFKRRRAMLMSGKQFKTAFPNGYS